MKMALPPQAFTRWLKTKALGSFLLLLALFSAGHIAAQNVSIATGLPSSASSGSSTAPMVITFCIENTRSAAVTLKGISNYMASGNASSTWKLFYSASSLSGQPNVTTWTVIDSVTGPSVSSTGIYTLFSSLNFTIPASTIYRFALQNNTTTINYGGATTTTNSLNSAGIYLYRGNYTISSSNVGYAGNASAPAFQPRFFCGTLYLDTIAGCAGTPNAPTITTTALGTSLCPNSTKTISASNPSPPASIKYQWEQASSSSGPWANVVGGTGDTTLNYTTAALSTTTWFRIKAICGTNTAASAAYQVPIAGTPTPGVISGGASVCAGSNSNYSVATVSGATSYTWSLPSGWTGSSTSNSISATSGSSGIISVTATGPCGTSSASNLSVTVNPLPTISITPSTAVAVCTGSGATLTGNGGVSYNWSPSGGLSASSGTSVTAAPTSTTTYTITGTDANGCSSTATKTVTVNPLPVVSITPSAAVAICVGSNTSLTANGASSYTWSPSSSLSASSGATVTASPGSTTTYTVNGTDANGCVNTETKTVTVNPLPTISVSPSGATALCGGAAGIVLTSSGAATYSWSPSATLSTSIGASVTASPVSGTTYTVTGTDANGCVNTATKFVGVGPLPTVSISPSASTTICSGNSVALTASGGVSYTWSPSGSLSSGNGATVTASPTTTTTYTVTATDAIGCMNTATKTVNVNLSPTVSISPATATAFCNGGSVSLTASGAVSYSWTPSAGLSASTGATVTAAPTSTNTYTVTGSAANGCIGTATKLVTVHPLPTITVTPGGTTTICSGLSTALTATGGVTYSWSPAASLNASIGASVTASPMSSITYTITGTDINGCVSTATKTVNVNTSPTVGVNPSTPPVVCFGSSAALTGTGANTYSWSPSTGLGSTTGTTVTATPPSTTTYTVTGTDLNGCTGTATKTVTVNPLPTVSISPTTAVSICAGASATLTANGAISYSWTPSTGLSATTGSTVSANPAASTTYTVTGTDANGCRNTATRLVNVLGLPTINTFLGSSFPICPGSSVSITATGAATYQWSPSSTLSSGTGSTVVATPPVTTTYTVTGTAINGCINTATRTVNVQPRPSSDISPSGYITLCQHDSVTLNATPGYQNYRWMIYGTTIATALTNTLTTSTGGFYTLQVIDSNGCSTTTSQPTVITVIQRPVPMITMAGNTMDAGAGYVGYQWYRGGAPITGANARFHTPVQGGLYTVEVFADSVYKCTGLSQAYQYTALGANTNAIAASIILHPNPANDVVHIDAPIAVDVTVTSFEGKIVFNERNAKELSVKNWADGIYQVILRDQSGNILKTEKLAKLSR